MRKKVIVPLKKKKKMKYTYMSPYTQWSTPYILKWKAPKNSHPKKFKYNRKNTAACTLKKVGTGKSICIGV